METSFMYHCLGIREQECTRTRYEGGKTILEIRTREDKLYCPKCKSRHVIKSGSTIRWKEEKRGKKKLQRNWEQETGFNNY